jgi:hypothetical protein
VNDSGNQTKDNNNMHKLLGVLVLSLSATVVAYASPSPAPATTSPSTLQQLDNYIDGIVAGLGSYGDAVEDAFWSSMGLSDPDAGSGTGTGTVAAPELDPAGMFAALTLLSGGLAVLRGRRSSKSK